MTPDELLTDWRATFAELFPTYNADAMQYRDSTLALGLYLCRRMDMLLKTRVIEPAFAEGYDPQPSVRPTGKRGGTSE